MKEQLSKIPKIEETETVGKPEQGPHFKPNVPCHELPYIQNQHLHECDTCAYPYYNGLPEEECLLTIHSYLLEKDIAVSPYQYLFIVAENFQLGVRSKASKNNLYYLNHVKERRPALNKKCETPMSERNEHVSLESV